LFSRNLKARRIDVSSSFVFALISFNGRFRKGIIFFSKGESFSIISLTDSIGKLGRRRLKSYCPEEKECFYSPRDVNDNVNDECGSATTIEKYAVSFII